MEATHENGNSSRRLLHVVALPLPGRGHINPMLSLCRRLATREGLLVTVVVTEEWLGLLSSFSSSAAAAASPASNLRLRAIPDVVPSESTRGQDYADFIQAVLTKMGGPVEALVAALNPPADAVVADALLPWAAGIGRRRGVPVAALFPQAAAVFLALHEFRSFDDGRPLSEIHASGRANGYLDYIPRNSSPHLADFLSKSSGQNMIRTFIQVLSWFSTAQSLLFNSFDELEGHAINTLRSKLSIPIYSVGPCTPYMTQGANPPDPYYQWLDSQQRSSVLYVSLGSFLPISDVHMVELATGLQMSGVPFLWVMRGDCTQIKKLSGEMGFVVPWCDQLSVLCHPSVGGFLTHCGWNSTLEGIYAGVPMVTYPLMWDQYPNSKLIVDDWKVGFRIKNEEEEGVVGREQIANVVQKLMDLDADDSRELRRRAREFKERSLKASNDGGSSTTSIDAFLQDVIRCKQKFAYHNKTT
ncbi:UDP-glycosyltransferase 87A2-like isoform X1 [Phoenix dactylifera]|uniref:Glycosyltransferase n=1 Tax=Phoenix dactylifera TaxID=42345 RepID=A0A8B7CG19_PHODC|nr:UDP-glycosyltransferase 87A2-like isoform X1 [Phoenix dactylifera]